MNFGFIRRYSIVFVRDLYLYEWTYLGQSCGPLNHVENLRMCQHYRHLSWHQCSLIRLHCIFTQWPQDHIQVTKRVARIITLNISYIGRMSLIQSIGRSRTYEHIALETDTTVCVTLIDIEFSITIVFLCIC